jgi:hypothetical protein
VKPEKQQIAIAEACGWTTHENPHDNSCHRYSAPKGTSPFLGRHALPNYLNDLNAMHEAEKVLTNDDADSGSQWSYVQQLIDITKAESMEMHREVFIVSTATAAQRAEAFLRTLGKWEDAK